jgi:hypothetical protein
LRAKIKCRSICRCGTLRQLCCTAAEIKNKTACIDSHKDIRVSNSRYNWSLHTLVYGPRNVQCPVALIDYQLCRWLQSKSGKSGVRFPAGACWNRSRSLFSPFQPFSPVLAQSRSRRNINVVFSGQSICTWNKIKYQNPVKALMLKIGSRDHLYCDYVTVRLEPSRTPAPILMTVDQGWWRSDWSFLTGG